jgi:hypothetical protein
MDTDAYAGGIIQIERYFNTGMLMSRAVRTAEPAG